VRHITISIDIYDVIRAGSVRQAVEAACPDDVMLATPAALGGQTFVTSGPGSGWTRVFDAGDYAVAAITEDAARSGASPTECMALDPDDGRIATGAEDGGVKWSDDSVVRIEVPSEDDALTYPTLVAEMVASVIADHGAKSDKAEWKRLVQTLREAADALEGIDTDELD